MKPALGAPDPHRLADELRSLQEGVALADRSSRGKLRLRGADRQSWLNRILSQDLAGLGPGDGCRALLLDVKGRVRADLRLYVAAEEIWIDTEPGRQAEVLAELEQYHFREDVQFADISAEYSLFTLTGPKAPGLLAELLQDLPADRTLPARSYAHFAFQEREQSLRVARPRLGAEPDFDLYWPRHLSWRHSRIRLQPDVLRGDAELQELALKHRQPRRESAFPERLLAGLRAAGGAFVSEQALEVQRIEAGRVREGPDLDEVLPPEAGLVPEAVALDKGCYPGQEVVQRMESRGRRRWRLAGLVLAGYEALKPGDTISDEGKRVGWISSAAWSPLRGRSIALAYLKPELVTVGAIHSFALEGRRQPFEIRALALSA